jgi:hypothetical protein
VGHVSLGVCGGEEGTDGLLVVGCGCWSLWRKPGISSARVWRSLNVDKHGEVGPAERVQHDTGCEEDFRDERSGKVWRMGAPKDQPPPGNPKRRV